MNKHTSGPWNHNGLGRIYKGEIYACGQSHIATVAHEDSWITEETSLANARLIAAAPEMYEALKMVIEHYGRDKYDPAIVNVQSILSKIEASL